MQDQQSAIELLLDRYEDPSYRGVLPSPPALTATETNPRCGDVVTVFVQLRGSIVHRAVFQGSGCTLSQAAADIAMELAEGRPVAEAAQLDAQTVLDGVGARAITTRHDCVALATRALRRALAGAGLG